MSRTIPLSKWVRCPGTYFAIVDDEDYEWLSQWSWHCNHGYAVRIKQVNGKRTLIRMHRSILKAGIGMIVDHKNGNKLDNRRKNLRFCTHAENMRNSKMPSRNRTGLKGVSFHKHIKKWIASIKFNGERTNLGYFTTPEEAHKAYCEKAKELHGEFARFE